IFQIYEKIDNVLGEVLNLIDPYTTILVMSDHGQGPLHRNFSLNTWLRREGYLSINSKYQKNMEYRLSELLRKFSDSWLLPLGMNTRNESIQKLMSKIRGIIIGLSSSNYLKTIDWYKTTAFCEGSFPAVYINVEGKFPMGRVRPDEAYEKLRDEIASKLEVLKDPQTGERIIEKIYKPEEIYHGEQIQNAPDLVCMLRNGYHGGGELEMLYFGLQNNDLFGNHRWSGQHRINGILIASGPNIIPGKTMTGARIIDLAPTILYLLGLPIPKSMDGRVLEDMFRKDYLSTHEIRFFEEKFPERLEGNGRPFSNEESELLKERLRGLGYIE
ncbi:MAG: alkaline phosphatase family protein, partial [Thermoplasmata archaeon]